MTVRFAIAILVLLPLVATAGDLSGRHRRWLDEVDPILSDYEQAVFLALDERDRNAFTLAFWEAREGEGDRRNAHRDAHLALAADAQTRFGSRDRPASRTARGRIWMQLGSPVDREIVPGKDGVRPLERWLYRGDAATDWPPWFSLLFVEREDGRYVLYDPVLERPSQLMVDSSTSIELALNALGAASPAVRTAALAPVLTDLGHAGALLRSPAVLVQLADLHNRQPVELSWVRDFLAERGLEALAADFAGHGVRSAAHGVWDGGGATSAHLAVEWPPDRITLVEKEGGYAGELQLLIQVFEAASGQQVLVQSRPIDIELSQAEFDRVRRYPMAYETMLPMVPGRYRYDLQVRDVASRRSAVASGSFEVPAVPDGMALAKPMVVARSTSSTAEVPRPFVLGGRLLYPAFGNRVSPDGELQIAFQLWPVAAGDLVVRYFVSQGEDELLGGFDKLMVEDPKAGPVLGTIRSRVTGLGPGNYTMSIEVGGATSPVRTTVEFGIEPALERSQPWLYVAKTNSGPGEAQLLLGAQLARLGDRGGWMEHLQRALIHPAVYAEARLRLAAEQLRDGDAEGALATLQPIDQPNSALLEPIRRLQWSAFEALGRGADVARVLADLVGLSPASPTLLSAAAAAAETAGEADKAMAYLRRSLQLDPDQRDVARQLRTLESNAGRVR